MPKSAQRQTDISKSCSTCICDGDAPKCFRRTTLTDFLKILDLRLFEERQRTSTFATLDHVLYAATTVSAQFTFKQGKTDMADKGKKDKGKKEQQKKAQLNPKEKRKLKKAKKVINTQ